MDYSYLGKHDPRIQVHTVGQPDLDVVIRDGLQHLTPIASADVWRQLSFGCTSQASDQPYPNSTVWDISGGSCSPSAADAFASVMAPPVVVLVRSISDRAEIITTTDAGVASSLASEGGDYAVLQPRAEVTPKKKKKQEPVPVLLGAGAGAALGAAALGPVGAIGGAFVGGAIAAWLT